MAKQYFGLFASALVYVIICEFQHVDGASFIHFECEMLPKEDCAFAIGQRGRRCLLETSIAMDGSLFYRCQTSAIEWGRESGDLDRGRLRAIKSTGHIESDLCVEACGLERLTVGISTDGLQTGAFKEKICSDVCQKNCPQVIHLYNIIYAEEGEELGRVCDELFEWKHYERERARRLSDVEVTRRSDVTPSKGSPAPAPTGSPS